MFFEKLFFFLSDLPGAQEKSLMWCATFMAPSVGSNAVAK
jgi:hypothetical protein